MIPLEQQVVSLEQAKKLKELGVKQGSIFHFQDHSIGYANEIFEASEASEMGECRVCSKSLVSSDDLNAECKCSIWKAESKYDPWEWQNFKNDEYTPISAFTCAELGVMLQDISNEKIYDFGWHSFYNSINQKWSVSWWYNREGYQPVIEFQESEAQARAAMLIHLLEQKIISVDEVNKKL